MTPTNELICGKYILNFNCLIIFFRALIIMGIFLSKAFESQIHRNILLAVGFIKLFSIMKNKCTHSTPKSFLRADIDK